MNDPRNRSGGSSSLTSSAAAMRQVAEAFVREDANPPLVSIETMSVAAVKQTLHELSVHEIELEMQNEERRRAQVELAAANARYFDLYDLAPVGYCTVSEAGLVLQANLTAATLLGITRGALVKRPFFQFLLQADHDSFYLLRQRLIKTGETQTDELRMVKSEGDQFWAHLVVSVAQDEEGVSTLRIALSDVSERKQTEKTLCLSEAKMQATLDAIPDLMFELSLDGRHCEFHSKRPECLLAPAQEQIGKLVSQVLPADAAQVIMAALQEANELGYSNGKQYPLVLAQGKMWFELSISRKATERGEEQRFVVLSRDITERIEAQEKLRASDIRYQSVVSALSEAIVTHERDGSISAWNAAAERILGLSVEEMQGRSNLDPHWRAIHEDGSVFTGETRPSRVVFRTGVPQLNVIMGIYKPDGTLTWVLINAVPIFNHGDLSPSSALVSFSDITARKLAEAELEQHRQQLEQLVALRTTELTAALAGSKVSRELLQRELIEHKRTEVLLQRSQLTLNQAARLAQLGAWSIELTDPENFERNPISWSAEMYRLLDCTAQDVPVPDIGSFIARVHPQDRQRVRDMTKQALDKKCSWQIEYRLVLKDGSERLILQMGEIAYAETGRPEWMHGAMMDVTEQRQLESRLRDSEAQLQMALKGADAGSFEWNIETGSIFWSKEVWVLNGLEPQDGPVRYSTWRQTVHPADLPRVQRITEAAVSQLATVEVEWQISLPPDLAPRWLMSRAQPMPEEDGRVVRYRGIIIDISKRRQAELTLERHRDHLEERVHERTAELTNAQAEERRLNRSLRLLGDCNIAVVHALNEKQLLNDICQLLVKTGGYLMAWVGVVEQDAAKAVRPVASFGDTTSYLESVQVSWDVERAIGRGPTGTAIRSASTQVSHNGWTNPLITPWLEGAIHRGYQSSVALPLIVNGQAWGALTLYSAEPQAFGAAEVKLLEELSSNMAFGLQSLRARAELERYQQQLEELVTQRTQEIDALNSELSVKARDADAANLAKGVFLATMSHELRTPLNAVVGLTGLLVGSPLSRRQHDYADKIQLSAQALRALIDDILDYSKIEAGELRLEQAPFSLNAILRTTAAVVGVGLGHKPVETIFDVGPEIPDALIGDALRLQQILLNLTSNAVKFTSTGVIVISVHRLPQEDASQGAQVALQFCVRDTGIGIATGQLGIIFDAFSQAEASTGRMYGGSGLGLTISARLAALMGGKIGVESTLGQGSEFCFEVPLTLGCSTSQGAPEGIPSVLNILIIDDHPLTRDILTRTCTAFGWQASAVDSGAAGLHELHRSAAAGRHYDLLLLDWHMPDMDGLAMLRQAYATPGIGLPLVVLMTTIFELERAVAASDDIELDGIATKPMLPTNLLEAVTRAYCGDYAPAVPLAAIGDRRLAGLRLLVAEDNLLNQEVVEQVLTRAGATVVLVANGVAAVAALRLDAEHFDAVLMDIQMPLMDGYTATRIIREELGLLNLPIIAVTAFAQPQDLERSRLAGMVGHVVKPLDVEDLLDTLLVERRSAVGRSTERQDFARHNMTAASKLDGLDIAAGLKVFGGDANKYRGILHKFVQMHGGDVDEGRRLFSVRDSEAAIRLLHGLSGVASLLQAHGLASLARAAEEALRSSKAIGIPVLFDQLQADMDRVKESIHQFEATYVET